MNLASVLGSVHRHLADSGQPVAIVGALALHTYGYTRATNDVDVVTRAEARPGLVAHLEAQGYETLHQSDGYSIHLHPDPKLGRVDVIYVDARTAERLFAACRKASVGGMDVFVPSPEHLAAMKVHAMKNDPSRTFREMADLQFLLGVDGVDREEIRGYFVDAGLEERWNELASTR